MQARPSIAPAQRFAYGQQPPAQWQPVHQPQGHSTLSKVFFAVGFAIVGFLCAIGTIAFLQTTEAPTQLSQSDQTQLDQAIEDGTAAVESGTAQDPVLVPIEPEPAATQAVEAVPYSEPVVASADDFVAPDGSYIIKPNPSWIPSESFDGADYWEIPDPTGERAGAAVFIFSESAPAGATSLDDVLALAPFESFINPDEPGTVDRATANGHDVLIVTNTNETGFMGERMYWVLANDRVYITYLLDDLDRLAGTVLAEEDAILTLNPLP